MIKFIVPAIIILTIVLFWEKISEIIFRRFNLRLNYIVIICLIGILGIIFTLLYY